MTRARAAVAAALLGAAALAGCGPPTFDVGEPFAVVATVPAANADDVGVDVEPQVGFNQPVNAATADAGLTLKVGEDEVERTVAPLDGGKVIRLSPRRFLPADTDVALTIAGSVESADGVKLDSDVVVSFHTAP